MRSARLAKILFIADSTPQSFWGSNSQEQREIDIIRLEFAPYLYQAENAPSELAERLGEIAEKLFSAIKSKTLREMYILYQ